MPAKKNLVGQTFGKLTVISEHPERTKHGQTRWVCQCDCGAEDVVKSASYLRTATVAACGCVKRQVSREICLSRTKHGQSHGRGKSGTKLYRAWTSMNRRCDTSSAERWSRYGGRGIVVCDGLKNSFQYFEKIVGQAPTPKHELDRKDNDGNYSCGRCNHCLSQGWLNNVRWVTHSENVRNSSKARLITYRGKTQVFSDWAKELGIERLTLKNRIDKLGWSIEKAFTTPVRKQTT